ncbi:MAG: homoserine kinase [Firmicutes bacterium]|nr:homoserine kinase [Bacillota bacterium]MDD4263765.1 homoserine kinase [Bacillota bacterium]MDD4693097.1 homoserine kinase [Bacillota bacterium]
MRALVPATTANLGPGFDLVGASLDLEMEVEAEFAEDYSLNETGYTEDASMKDHLVFKVMVEFLKEHGIERPFALKTLNRIPFARGLGSSSAAIVGALVLANELCKKPLTTHELLQKAIEIEGHPDNVAPALLGGVILSTATTFIKLPAPFVESFALVPDYKISTKAARKVLPSTVSRDVAVGNSGLLAQLVIALERGDSEMFLDALSDKIHEPYRGELIPGYKDLSKEAKKRDGKLIISGSGPTLLYLKNSGIQEAERDVKELSEIWSSKHHLQNEVVHIILGTNSTKIIAEN